MLTNFQKKEIDQTNLVLSFRCVLYVKNKILLKKEWKKRSTKQPLWSDEQHNCENIGPYPNNEGPTN